MQKNIWLITLILIFSSSCSELFDVEQEEGDDGLTNINNLNEYIIGSPPNAERQLSNEERDRGQDICNAFREMRNLTRSVGKNVTFRMTSKDCNDRTSPPVTVAGNIRSTPNQTPRIDGNGLYFKEAYSDIYYHLQEVCNRLMRGDESGDTFSLDNITSIKVRFRETGGRSYVQVYEFIRSRLDFIHTIEVGMNSANEGFNMMRSESAMCNTPGKVYSRTQTITSFD